MNVANLKKVVMHLNNLTRELLFLLTHEIKEEENKLTYRQAYIIANMIGYEVHIIDKIANYADNRMNNNMKKSLVKLAVLRVKMIVKLLAIVEEMLKDTKYNNLVNKLGVQTSMLWSLLMEAAAHD